MATKDKIFSSGDKVVTSGDKVATGCTILYYKARKCIDGTLTTIGMTQANGSGIVAFSYSGTCYYFGDSPTSSVPSTILTPSDVTTYSRCCNCGNAGGGNGTDTPTIVVGDIHLLANTPNQHVYIYVTNRRNVKCMQMYAQIAGGAAGGPETAPSFTELFVVGSGELIFDCDHFGQSPALTGIVNSWLAKRETWVSGSSNLVANGAIALLIIDTTGYTSGTWALKVGATRLGDSVFGTGTSDPCGGITASITNGNIIIP